MLVIATACAREGDLVSEVLASHPKGRRIEVCVVGVGPEEAAQGARGLARLRPRVVLVVGFAGGLRPGITAGTLVLGTATSATVLDPAISSPSLPARRPLPDTPEILRPALARLPLRFAQGGLLTVPFFLDRAADKLALGREGAFLACDMESAVLHDACGAMGVPMALVRAVSDGSDEDVPPAASSLRGGWVGRAGRVARWGLTPSAPRELWRMVRGGRRAEASLRQAVGPSVDALLAWMDGRSADS